jgi:hypothetical protein
MQEAVWAACNTPVCRRNVTITAETERGRFIRSSGKYFRSVECVLAG